MNEFFNSSEILDKIIFYFDQICSTPHNSLCEEKIANFMVDFANKKNLEAKKDNFNNVIIKKTINVGKPYTVLHSHLDMVCVSDPTYNIDFSSQGIKLINTGKYLTAYKTSLGADNGIGVAIIMALLDQAPYNIEAFFTADEEKTSTGAENFDYSQITGKNLISLDGFRANEIVVGCASVCDMQLNFNNNFNILPSSKNGYLLTISGLKGGHSGADIDKPLGNSIKVASQILKNFKDVQLSQFEAGNQCNFIPNTAKVLFLGKKQKNLEESIVALKSKLKGLKIKITKHKIDKILSKEDSDNTLKLIEKIQHGVIAKQDRDILLSQNLASINLTRNYIRVSQRGLDKKLEKKNLQKLKNLAVKYNGSLEILDSLPCFKTDKNAQLVNKLCKLSSKVNRVNLKKDIKNVSLEACIFKHKLPQTEIVIVSPKIENPHSTRERVLIPSIAKTYNLVESYLKGEF